MDADIPKDMNLIFSGGEIRFPKEATAGDFAINNLSEVYQVNPLISHSYIKRRAYCWMPSK